MGDKLCLFSHPSKELSLTIIHAPPNDPLLAKNILTWQGQNLSATVLWRKISYGATQTPGQTSSLLHTRLDITIHNSSMLPKLQLWLPCSPPLVSLLSSFFAELV